MTISPIGGPYFPETYTEPPPPSIAWDHFNLQEEPCHDGLRQPSVALTLAGTTISCCLPINTDISVAGSLATRKEFLEKTFETICRTYPKSAPLYLISMGSDHLLMEYILAKSLKEQGYTLFFIGIDPSYKIADKHTVESLQPVLQTFRREMDVPQEQIRYLSDARHLEKYLPVGAPVVLLESMPPYGYCFMQMEKKQLPGKSIEAFFGGGRIVPKEAANALCLFPKSYATVLKDIIAYGTAIPCPFAIEKDGKETYLDYGVKIAPDGTFYVNLEPQWIKKHLEIAINKLISGMREQDPKRPLSQKEISFILQEIEKFIISKKIPLDCHFSLDYGLGRKAAKDTILKHSVPEYRTLFTLRADATQGYRIDIEEIT